tara:strand:+ start:901 stop:2391 length:1491 start_codon:yes stop_codon:yes gene_type:complete
MPENPLDLFVQERLLTVISGHGTNTPALTHSFDLDVNIFTIDESRHIQGMINNPCNYTSGEIHLNRNILYYASVGRRGNNEEMFIPGMYSLACLFLTWIHEKHNVLYLDDGNRTSLISEDSNLFREDCCTYFDNDGVALWQTEAHYGVIDRHGREGWFFNDDCCFDGYGDIYYLNDDVAESNGVTWRECCERYMSCDDDDCCDDARPTTQGETFDESYNGKYSKEQLNFVNLTKVSGMDYTFGLELETSNSSTVPYTSEINMRAVYDGSTDGLEYVSGVLQGNTGVNNMEYMCSHLNDEGAKIDRKCGVHIHVGGAEFNRRFSIMVLKLCLAIEDDVYKLLPESRQGNTYCKKLPADLVDRLNFNNYRETLGTIIQSNSIDKDYNKKKAHPGGRYNSQRYYWANITNYSTTTGTNTIEFRPHSGSLDFNKIYNWLLVCMSIVKFAENNQRRIWTSGMSKKSITLNEVLKFSLNKKLYNQVYSYCTSRAKRFGHTLA